MLRRQPYQPWLVFLAYLLVALYLTAPILSDFSSRFIGGDAGDVYEMARHVWWVKTALQSGKDVFHHSMLGYPTGFRAAQFWVSPLRFFPMWLFAFFLPLPAAYNLGLLLSLALNGCSMYVLARRKLATARRLPAFFAGLAYLLFPAIQGSLFEGHAGLLAQWPLPLLILFLFDFADNGGWRRFAFALLCFLLTAFGNILQCVYALAPLILMFLLARMSRRDQVGAARVLAVALAGGFILLQVFVSPVLGGIMANQRFLEAGGHVRYSLDLLSPFSPSFANPFWHDIATHSPQVIGTSLGHGAAYLGVLGGCLAVLGALYRRAARWWLLVALVAWLLALGPVLKANGEVVSTYIVGYETVVPLPFALVGNLPYMDLARTPVRFMFLFAVMFALLIGYGADVYFSSRLAPRRDSRLQLVIAFLLALVLIEDYRLFGSFPNVPAEIPREIESLKHRRDVRAVYNVPYDHLLAAKEAMYLQTAHRKPLIAGHDARVTPVDPARLALLSKFRPALLDEAGADIVIINKARALESGQMDLLRWRARQGLGEPLFEDERYAVYETPDRRDRAPAVYSPVVEDQSHVTYIYKEQPGWLEFNAILEAGNRRVHLSLNDTPLEALDVKGRIPISVSLPIDRRGYHTFRITLDPPCPAQVDASVLVCQRVRVENVRLEVLSEGAIYDPIRIEDGIILAGYLLPAEARDETIKLRFWWRFESERSPKDVRFVHVLDEQGRPAPGGPADHNFGTIAAGSELTETVTLDKSKLQSGAYRVLTGWYELPQAIRYDVLTDVEGAQDDTVVLGTMRIRD